MAAVNSYAGIGARKTPAHILEIMSSAAGALQQLGWTLRTGGADGADRAFLEGLTDPTEENLELYIPWEGFQGFTSNDAPVHALKQMPPSLVSEAFNIAQEFHPAWDDLSEGTQSLMTRNSFQVLGMDLETPASFVICWTPSGAGGGGTGQALRIAKHYDIPVIDLGGLSVEQAEEAIHSLL